MSIPKKTIFLIDDHPIFRSGMRESINSEPNLCVCGESSGAGEDVLETVRSMKPDLVVLDVTLREKNGMDLLKSLLEMEPELPVLMMSMHDEALYAERCIRAGARGYIMKNEEPERVLKSIQQIISGNVYLSETASSAILQNLTGRPAKGSAFAVDLLSEREFEVFQLLGLGRTTSQIAAQLGLSVRTVVVHCANIRGKLNIKHSPELVAYAARWQSQQSPPAASGAKRMDR